MDSFTRAAVLPLRRFSPWPLDFAALVIGSMTPDVGYYIERFDLATFDHTLKGSLLAGLPVGTLLVIAFYVFCKPVAYLLPRPHRPALLPICPDFDGLRPARWPILLLSLLIGIWTHNLWDAFTHDTGWFVQRIWWLRDSVVHMGSGTLDLPTALQYLSTFVGAVIVAVAYFLWLRRQPTRGAFADDSDTWRYMLGVGICALALLIVVPAAVHLARPKQGALFVRAVIFRTATFAPEIAIPCGLIAASVAWSRRRRHAT
ncbi:MAG: DUF4184 family protein [Chthoniobacterales bacterium]